MLCSEMPRWKKMKARQMRNNPTKAEARLWAAVRKRQLGFRILRQKPIAGYIADFYCPRGTLVIEVDGSAHQGRSDYDRRRDANLAAAGLMTLRFTNAEVFGNLTHVLNTICSAVHNREPYTLTPHQLSAQ